MSQETNGKHKIGNLVVLFILSEILFFILIGACAEYGTGVSPTTSKDDSTQQKVKDYLYSLYPQFMDVHVMIFIGFGFLMTFLKTHSWTSVGFNFIICCWCLQWSMLLLPFLHKLIIQQNPMSKIQVDLTLLINCDFAAGAVMISFGALLGKINLIQLWILAFFEIIFYSINFAILEKKLYITDIGGSMSIHTFGAYFGLTAAFFFNGKIAKESKQCGSNYNSNLFAMIGTIFLWIYWPSFNGAIATGDAQQRSYINTIISITASCLSAIITSRFFFDQKLDMEILLNATLSGGVVIGASANLSHMPVIPFAIGFITGVISAIGFAKINAFLLQKINLHDTCGVHYLHGIPGIIGAVAAAIHCANLDNSWGINNANLFLQSFGAYPRSNGQQFGYQMAALLVTLVLAIVGGLFTGFIVSRQCFNGPLLDDMFKDDMHFHGVDYGYFINENYNRNIYLNPLEISNVSPMLQKQYSIISPKSKDANNILDQETQREIEVQNKQFELQEKNKT